MLKPASPLSTEFVQKGERDHPANRRRRQQRRGRQADEERLELVPRDPARRGHEDVRFGPHPERAWWRGGFQWMGSNLREADQRGSKARRFEPHIVRVYCDRSHGHALLSEPPNGSRLSCGALKKDSFPNLRVAPASSAC